MTQVHSVSGSPILVWGQFPEWTFECVRYLIINPCWWVYNKHNSLIPTQHSMSSVIVSADWQGTAPLDDDGLLTEAEGMRVDSWIRPRVYNTGIPAEVAFLKLAASGTRSLKRRYGKFSGVQTADVVWGWAATEVELDVTRTRRGGGADAGWRASARVLGRWEAQSPELHFSMRTCALLPIVPYAVGVSRSGERGPWCLTHATLRGLYHSVRCTYKGLPLGLFYADVLWMAFIGYACGDLVRRSSLSGVIKWGWWDELIPDLALYYPELHVKVLCGYVDGLRQVPLARIQVPIAGTVIWVIDLCCGFQSRRKACMSLLREHVGTGTCTYIGLDISPLLVAGDETFVPDWCVDLLDTEKLPIGQLIQSVARYFGLSIEFLMHVFVSSPCETNSRLMHCNSTRGGAYRDTKQIHHPPLPVHPDRDIACMETGYTTQDKHDLAVLHDKLEERIFHDLRSEALEFLFTFSGENPVGSLFHKACMIAFHITSVEFSYLRVVTLEHCAYGGYFGKSTHHYTNLSELWWQPRGLTGDGRCGGRGVRTGTKCQYGYVNGETNRWNHTYAIGQEAWRERVPGRLSRDQCKNMIPVMETQEQLSGAIAEWRHRNALA